MHGNVVDVVHDHHRSAWQRHAFERGECERPSLMSCQHLVGLRSNVLDLEERLGDLARTAPAVRRNDPKRDAEKPGPKRKPGVIGVPAPMKNQEHLVDEVLEVRVGNT